MTARKPIAARSSIQRCHFENMGTSNDIPQSYKSTIGLVCGCPSLESYASETAFPVGLYTNLGWRRCRNARSIDGAGCYAGRVIPVARAKEVSSSSQANGHNVAIEHFHYLYRTDGLMNCQALSSKAAKSPITTKREFESDSGHTGACVESERRVISPSLSRWHHSPLGVELPKRLKN